MRIRTGHRPDQWTDNIPGAVGRRTGVSAWGTHNAVVIGSMVPALNGRERNRTAKANFVDPVMRTNPDNGGVQSTHHRGSP